MSNFNIMMFGPSRCGKSSVLASIVGWAHQNLNKLNIGIYQHYSNDDDTGMLDSTGNLVESSEKGLNAMLFDMKSFAENLQEHRNKKVLGGLFGTSKITRYDFEIKPINGLDRKYGGNNQTELTLTFWDIPGEWFNTNRIGANDDSKEAQENLIKKIAEISQVMIVVVDTPNLLYSVKSKDGDYIDKLNLTQELSICIRLFGSSSNNGDKQGKLLMFVPVKCEHWLNRKDYNKVEENIKFIYNNMNYNPVSEFLGTHKQGSRKACILPIKTLGNVEWDRFTDFEPSKRNDKCGIVCWDEEPSAYSNVRAEDTMAMEINGETKIQHISRCEIMEGSVRLADGKRYDESVREYHGGKVIKVAETALTYPYTVIKGKPMPYAWYMSNGNNFNPQYGETIVAEILKFVTEDMVRIANYSSIEQLSSVIQTQMKRDYSFSNWLKATIQGFGNFISGKSSWRSVAFLVDIYNSIVGTKELKNPHYYQFVTEENNQDNNTNTNGDTHQ